jgi:hypothetical protein
MSKSTITTFFGLTNPWLWHCDLFVDCKPLKILQVYDNTCFGHVMFKAYQLQQMMIRFIWDKLW